MKNENKIKIAINTIFFIYTVFSFILCMTEVLKKIIVNKINTTSYHTPTSFGIVQMKYKKLFTPPFFRFGSIILFLFIIVWLVHNVL